MEHSEPVWRRLRSRIGRLDGRRIRKAAGIVHKRFEAGPAGRPSDSTAAPEQPSVISAQLIRIGWVDTAGGPRLRIQGVAWRPDGEAAGSRVAAVTLVSGDDTVGCPVSPWIADELNDYSQNPRQDRSGSGFIATVDAADLLPAVGPDVVFERRWQLRITVRDAAGQLTGPFRNRDESSSAGQLHSSDIGAGCLARPVWDRRDGLLVTVLRRPLYVRETTFDGTELDVVVGVRGAFKPTAAVLRSGEAVRELTFTPTSERTVTVRCPVADLPDLVADGARSRTWYLQLADADGHTRQLHWQGRRRPGHREGCPADPRIAVRYGPNGVLRVDVQPCRLVVDDVTVDAAPGPTGSALTITGECHGVSAEAGDWALTGGRHRLPARRVRIEDGRFTAVFGLDAVPAWGSRPLPLPTGSYRLLARTAPGSDTGSAAAPAEELPADLHPAYSATLYAILRTPGNRIRVGRADRGRLQLAVGPPLADGERSRYRYHSLEVMHRTEPIRPTDTVFFDSFDGKAANDNTLAVHDELRRRRPDLRRLWTVADLSVEIPDGGEPLVFRSEGWWRALTSSRYVVTNCWLPRMFLSRDHQTVLQTWHGTPLKLLGSDRIGTGRGDDYRERTAKQVAQWSLLISQNPYSSEIFRSAYGYAGRVLEIGYPRNDVLTTADDVRRAVVRDRLGLGIEEQVVLYVPTWREKAKGLFRELDFDAVGSALGDRGRLLVRGHANTIRHGVGVTGRRLLDVTLYPDIADLYLVADLMITDYSSTMFDYSVTGKPMIFFAPDLAEYTDSLRGTYFDLVAKAPGPVVRTTEDVIGAIKDSEGLREDYARAYAAWQRRFNPYDDGHASQRAVDALLGDG